MGSDKTDEELMLAYAGGDLLAFEMLYRRHRGTLYRFLMRTLRHRADAVTGPKRSSRRFCCRSRTISSSTGSGG